MVIEMSIFNFAYVLATLLCTIVAGIVLTFSTVVMPGIKTLNDREYLQSFTVMDRVIQNNQPVFMLVWLGSIIALLATAWLGTLQLEGLRRVLIMSAFALYILGVQLPTMIVNIPLNNHLQSLDVFTLSDTEAAQARLDFEVRWTRWNFIRTVFAILTSCILLLLLVLPGRV